MDAAAGGGTALTHDALPVFRGMAAARTQQVVVPPLNFDMVAPGLYRSGHPNERNFAFLRRLGLRSIVYLGTDDYRANMHEFARAEGIRVFHHRVNMNKEPFTESASRY